MHPLHTYTHRETQRHRHRHTHTHTWFSVSNAFSNLYCPKADTKTNQPTARQTETNQKDSKTDRPTSRQQDRDTNQQTARQICQSTDNKTEILTNRLQDRDTNQQTRQRDNQQTVRQTNRQPDGQRDQQTQWDIQTTNRQTEAAHTLYLKELCCQFGSMRNKGQLGHTAIQWLLLVRPKLVWRKRKRGKQNLQIFWNMLSKSALFSVRGGRGKKKGGGNCRHRCMTSPPEQFYPRP